MEEYLTAEMEIVQFEDEDIITSSVMDSSNTDAGNVDSVG